MFSPQSCGGSSRPTEMFPIAGNRASTPGFAVTGIISRPFPNGSLTTPCLIRQSVTTVSEASGTAARCHSVLKSSYGQFSLASFCRVSKRLSNGRVICFSLISMCIVEKRLELMFSNEAIICQTIGCFVLFFCFFLRKIGQLHMSPLPSCSSIDYFLFFFAFCVGCYI